MQRVNRICGPFYIVSFIQPMRESQPRLLRKNNAVFRVVLSKELGSPGQEPVIQRFSVVKPQLIDAVQPSDSAVGKCIVGGAARDGGWDVPGGAAQEALEGRQGCHEVDSVTRRR